MILLIHSNLLLNHMPKESLIKFRNTLLASIALLFGKSSQVILNDSLNKTNPFSSSVINQFNSFIKSCLLSSLFDFVIFILYF